MQHKVLVEVYVPELDVKYDLFIPANKKVGNIILLLVKAINELSEGAYPVSVNHALMNSDTCMIYDLDLNLKDANILNGTKLILIWSRFFQFYYIITLGDLYGIKMIKYI